MKKILQNISLALFSLVLIFFISEYFLRHHYLSKGQFFTWLPDTKYYSKSLPEGSMPGVHGLARFIINSSGIRGDEFHHSDGHRILAIGGSTTEGIYLDQTEVWTNLLQRKLKHQGHQVWVGNVGKSGLTSRSHVLQMKHMVPQYPKIDTILFLMGINDLQNRLESDSSFKTLYLTDKDFIPEELSRSFESYPAWKNKSLPFYKRTAFWLLIEKIRSSDTKSVTKAQEKMGSLYELQRLKRQMAQNIRLNLPDMSEALKEYSKNINEIIDLSEELSIKPMFVTQPVMWDENLPEHLQKLLWFGWIGDHSFETPPGDFYSVEALEKGMNLYNQVLIEVCQNRGVDYIDLASITPKNTTIFMDDCHFNESGSIFVAAHLAKYFSENILN